jgi:hypothetical protein
MEIILAAVGTLVLLTAFDAHLWPKPISTRDNRQVCRTPRRMVARRHLRHPVSRLRPVPVFSMLQRRPSGPLWWWE